MILCKRNNNAIEIGLPETKAGTAGSYRLELFRLGTVGEVFNFMEEGVFNEWGRVAGNLNLPDEDARGLAWGIKGHNYPWVLSHVNFSENSRVLDVGGGYSLLPVIIRERFKNEVWVADDFGVESGEPLWSRWGDRERQKARYPDVNYVFERLGDISRSSLKSGYFDVIYSVSALEHIPANLMKDVFGHMLHILKPGGVLVHCVDVELNRINRVHSDSTQMKFLTSPTSWFGFVKEYFEEKNINDYNSVNWDAEVDESVENTAVTESPEIVYKYYEPKEKAKPYKRVGTLTFIIRSLKK